jgi:hypothetical protein
MTASISLGDMGLLRSKTAMACAVSIKNQQMVPHKIANFYRANDTINKTKRPTTVWEKIFTNPKSDRGLISNMYQELKKLNSRNSNNSIKKCGIELNKEFSNEEYQRAEMHLKQCSTSLIIREMKIKTTLRFYLTPVRMARIKNSGDSRCWRGYGERGTLLHWWWDCKLVKPLWKSVWHFLRELDIVLLLGPSIPLLGIYPEDVPTGNKDTCYTMFIATLFIIARSCKEPRCPSTKEWIKKMWYIYTMEYYSAIKNNEFLKFLGKWMYLENIILSEVTQSQKKSLDMYSLISGYYPRSLEYPRYNLQNIRKLRRKTNAWILHCSLEYRIKYPWKELQRQRLELR